MVKYAVHWLLSLYSKITLHKISIKILGHKKIIFSDIKNYLGKKIDYNYVIDDSKVIISKVTPKNNSISMILENKLVDEDNSTLIIVKWSNMHIEKFFIIYILILSVYLLCDFTVITFFYYIGSIIFIYNMIYEDYKTKKELLALILEIMNFHKYCIVSDYYTQLSV